MRLLSRMLLAAALLLAPASAAQAQAPDDRFPFSTGEAPARMVPLDMPYTPRIEVWFPATVAEEQRTRLVGILAEHLGHLPPTHRAALREVVFDPGSYPGARHTARALGRQAFKAAGIAIGNAIVFYRNPPSTDWMLIRAIVLHEMGHCFASARFGSPKPPAEWARAVQADGNALSAYSDDAFKASNAYTEDFAEAYYAFFEARIRGGEVPNRNKALFPHRTLLLETYTY